MAVYEIINPSDAYTLEAKDFATACVASLMLSQAYGLKSRDGSVLMPPFLFGDPQPWFMENFGCDVLAYIKRHLGEVAACLDSVVIGHFTERDDYYAGLELITDPEKRQEWRNRWLDRRLSSLNNIGQAAWDAANRLRELASGEAVTK